MTSLSCEQWRKIWWTWSSPLIGWAQRSRTITSHPWSRKSDRCQDQLLLDYSLRLIFFLHVYSVSALFLDRWLKVSLDHKNGGMCNVIKAFNSAQTHGLAKNWVTSQRSAIMCVNDRPSASFPLHPYFCPQSACSTIFTINAAISDHHWSPVKVSIVYLCFTLSQLWTKILEIVLMVHDDLPNFEKQTSCQTRIKSNFCFEQFSLFVLPETAVCDIAQTFVCSSPIMHNNWPLSCDCDVKQRSDELTGFGWVF